MAKWNSQKLVSERSLVRLQAVLVFSCVYQELNKRYQNTRKIYYHFFVLSWSPHHYL